MARWRWENWDDKDIFVIPGPILGEVIAERLGSVFPDDATVMIERISGTSETIEFRMVPSVVLCEGDILTLPGIPLAGGPLMYVMDRLLGPEGCPWDKKQTPLSLLRYLLDESYEAAEALVADDIEAFIEELGDVLLQVVFQGALIAETSFPQIAQNQARKLIGRHPHVFSDADWNSSDQVRQQWDKLKAEEPPHQRSATWVYPGLVAAKRLSKLGMNPQSPVYQEFLGLLEVYFDKNPGKIEEILADAAWAVAAGGRIHHQDAEWALWKKVAEAALEHGVTPSNTG